MYEGTIGFKSKWGVGSTFGYKLAIECNDELELFKDKSKVDLVEQTNRLPVETEVLDTEQ
jgi:hypothetical protein